MGDKIKRKLAIILATDCVGFSRHMEQDEEGTLTNLKACREIIDPVIDAYGGRIFHTAGDSVIAEFPSSVECVNAAIEFQTLLAERNKVVTSGPRLQWRVGIHLDDVIIETENIFGSGVNVAARLESQCEPGQILVSRVVSDQVRKRVNFAITAAGTRALKNISDNFEVFSIVPTTDTAVDAEAITVDSAPAAAPSPTSQMSPDGAYKQKLAVLPFSNRNKDEDSGFLVDGIVEDLITEFSRIRELEIVSRQSSFDFRDRDQERDAFVEKFGIDYLVTGGIRSSGKRVRISVELAEAASGKVAWSQKYDRVLDDIFDVQDEIVRRISLALLGEIEISSLQRAKRKPTENMTSYEFLLRGKELHHRFTAEANAEALRMFDEAIRADDGNAQAYAWKACTLGQGMGRGYLQGDFGAIFEEAKGLVGRAVELNENDFECHRLLTEVYLSAHEFERALAHGQIAIKLVPNDPRVLSVYGEVLLRNGRIAEGLQNLEKAYELDPVPQGQSTPDRRLAALFAGYFIAGDHARCEAIFPEIQTLDIRTWLMRVSVAQQTGQDPSSERWYQDGKERFADRDWAMEIDRFHLNDDAMRTSLHQVATGL